MSNSAHAFDTLPPPPAPKTVPCPAPCPPPCETCGGDVPFDGDLHGFFSQCDDCLRKEIAEAHAERASDEDLWMQGEPDCSHCCGTGAIYAYEGEEDAGQLVPCVCAQ